MLLVVGVIALLTDLLKVASRGGPWQPAALIVQHLARSTLTGVVAAGAWSGLIEWRAFSPTTSVAVAVIVAMLGVDVLERLLKLFAEKRLGVVDEGEGKK